MKATLRLKSFPGHKGIPGHQGGSLPEGEGGGGTASAKPATVKSSADIDNALAGTGFSSKTKSLYAYARNGMQSPMISKTYNILKSSNLPKEDIMPITLYVANALMNGSRVGSFGVHYGINAMDPGYPGIFIGGNMMLAIKSISDSTIKKWRIAIDKLG